MSDAPPPPSRRVLTVEHGTLAGQVADYHRDCLALTPAERLAAIQRLRVQLYGQEAATGRVQRLSPTLERLGS